MGQDELLAGKGVYQARSRIKPAVQILRTPRHRSVHPGFVAMTFGHLTLIIIFIHNFLVLKEALGYTPDPAKPECIPGIFLGFL